MSWFEVQVDDPYLASVFDKIIRKYDDLEEWDQAKLIARLERAMLDD